MKIGYDAGLYREIASLHLNEIVQVENRKGERTTIHITNITKLSWRELQLLMPEGADRFTKMILLFERHRGITVKLVSPVRGQKLTHQETAEISAYVRIFRENEFRVHSQVNNYITDNDLWSAFPTIRSLNDHGRFTEVPGIQPKYFEVACELTGISSGDGLPLDAFRKY
jgi:hypothetical protein